MNGHSVNDEDSSSDESFASAIDKSKIKSTPLHPHVLSSLDQKLKRVKLIQQTDESYHRAINDILDQTMISVLVEPYFYGRHCMISVMAIATANNTYVFDLKALGVIFKELAKVLEADCPRKIMHYSHRICDLLWHQHKLKINGICDTFVAWCVVNQDQTYCTLQEAISLTFDLNPSELTCDEMHSVSEKVRNFITRPLSKAQLQYLAKVAILQYKLHDTLIFENICSGLQIMSSKFSCELSKEKNFGDLALKMGPCSKYGFDSIDEYYQTPSILN